MIQNIAQTRCHKSKRPSNQTPNYTKPKFQSTKANNQTLNTCTLVFFGPLAMALSIWSQCSHHIRSPFYHTTVHDNDSMNEMLQRPDSRSSGTSHAVVQAWTQPSAQLSICLAEVWGHSRRVSCIDGNAIFLEWKAFGS